MHLIHLLVSVEYRLSSKSKSGTEYSQVAKIRQVSFWNVCLPRINLYCRLDAEVG